MVEILVLMVVLFIAAVLLFPALDRPSRTRAPGIKCVNNLKNVALAARIYATDNNDLMPGAYFLSNKVDLATIDVASYFPMLSNELSTPKIIVCPADQRVKPLDSFTNLTTKNISYFASLSADEKSPQTFLFGDRNIEVNGQRITGLLTLTTNSPVSWSKEMHNEQGNIAMGDGSVRQFSNARLKSDLREQEIVTNLLLFP